MLQPRPPPDPTGTPIEIQIDHVAQLFHTLDPFPFRERDLDKEAEEFIVGWARELPKHEPVAIIVHLPAREAESEQGREIADALHQYFRYRASVVTNDLRELFRFGRYALAIGLVTLSFCIALGQIARTTLGANEFSRILGEGLAILGWVANWRPIEIFLYEWLPLVRRRRLFQRLARAHVTLAPR